MGKFRDVTDEMIQTPKQEYNFDIDGLNQRYDALIEKFEGELLVTNETRTICDELKAMQNEVSTKLMIAQQRVKELDEQQRRSVIDKTDFDLDAYEKAKRDAFRLDSLNRTLNERVSGIENSFMFKK